MEKTFCCFCCRSGPLTARISISASGFVPGQNIPIIAEVDNASNVKIDRLKIVLCKLVEFKVHTPRHAIKRNLSKIAEVSIGPIGVGDTQTKQLNIVIPPLPPSNLMYCRLIDLDYELQVILKQQ